MKLSRKYIKALIAFFALYLTYQSLKLESSFGNVSLIWSSSTNSFALNPGLRKLRNVDEELYFKLEMRLKFINQNLEHRLDFVSAIGKSLVLSQNRVFRASNDSLVGPARKKSLFTRVQIEKLYSINKYKAAKLASYSRSIQAKLHGLQDQKCRLDNIVYCSLEQHNCGFGCNLHTFSVALLISFYWERTLIFAKKKVPGMEVHEEIFLPIAKQCRLHDMDNTTIIKEAIHPYKVFLQVLNGEKFFLKFRKEIVELQRYHQDPVAFFIGNLMHFIMRFNESSAYYQELQLANARFNFSHPYVGIHVRRSDKFDEAGFFEPHDYMLHVEDFYQSYFLKNPDKVNTTQRMVYVASDEREIFKQFERDYPNYRFAYNDSFTHISGNKKARYSQNGYLSLIADVFFLSNADHLVCTFSSNICRLAYELMLYRVPDTYKLAKSLDTYYMNYFEMDLYQIAIMDNLQGNFGFRKGDIIKKEYFNGQNFDGYHQNGYSSGKLLHMLKRGGDYPSYKAKDFYF